MLAFIKLTLFIGRHIVDDALISIAYARSLVDGDGLRVTPHSPVVEGFSNPTWTLFLAVFEKIGVNSMRPARYGGLVFVVLAMPLLFLWGPVSQQRRIRLEDAIAPIFACTNATLAYWTFGGLETGLLVFLLSLFGLLLFAPETRRTSITLGLVAAAVTLTRPEGALYVAAGVLPRIVDTALQKRFRPSRNEGIALVAFLAPVLLYLLFRRAYFGLWLPNTYYAKHSLFAGFAQRRASDYVRGFVRVTPSLFVLAGMGVLLSFAGGKRTARTALAAALLVVSMSFFAWYAKGDWMMEWRFLAPAVPFVCCAIAAGVAGLRTRLEMRSQQRRRLRIVLALLAGLVGVALFFTTKKHQSRWRVVIAQGGDVPMAPEARPIFGDDLRRLIAPFGMTHPLVAGPDLGWMSLGMRDSEIIDLAGLANVTFAQHYRNPSALRDYFAHEGYPTLLLVWGPSIILRDVPDLLGKYSEGTPAPYHAYKVYTNVSAASDDRCPGGKAAFLHDTADQIVERVLSDLRAETPVEALARWRCYSTYRTDAELPTKARQLEIAKTALSLADRNAKEGRLELALRNYSFCAVIGVSSYSPSVSCRIQAERLRTNLFPPPQKPRR